MLTTSLLKAEHAEYSDRKYIEGANKKYQKILDLTQELLLNIQKLTTNLRRGYSADAHLITINKNLEQFRTEYKKPIMELEVHNAVLEKLLEVKEAIEEINPTKQPVVLNFFIKNANFKRYYEIIGALFKYSLADQDIELESFQQNLSTQNRR